MTRVMSNTLTLPILALVFTCSPALAADNGHGRDSGYEMFGDHGHAHDGGDRGGERGDGGGGHGDGGSGGRDGGGGSGGGGGGGGAKGTPAPIAGLGVLALGAIGYGSRKLRKQKRG